MATQAFQKCPQYCWEFHDQLWKALSGTTSEKRGIPSHTEGERIQFWKCSGSLKCLNYRAWGIPSVLSRGGIPRNALRAFPVSFRNFSGKCQPYGGYGPAIESNQRDTLITDTDSHLNFISITNTDFGHKRANSVNTVRSELLTYRNFFRISRYRYRSVINSK